MKKLTFSLLFIVLLFSCGLDGIFDGEAYFNGDIVNFIKDGYSIPIISIEGYSGGEIPIVDGVEMFQSNTDYNLRIDIINPSKMNLKYRIFTETQEFMDITTDNTLKEGFFEDVKLNLTIPIRLNDSADKNYMKCYMKLESDYRNYDTPDIQTMYVNNRPSTIIPKDALGGSFIGKVWEPEIGNGKATIYWSYTPTVTDTDISHIFIQYNVDGIVFTEIINYDQSSKSFGNNSFTVNDIGLEQKIDFSVNVFDTEGLDSGYISTNTVWKESNSVTVTFNTDIDSQTLYFSDSLVKVPQGNTVTITPDTDENFDKATNWKWYENNTLESSITSSFTFDSTGKSGDYIINCQVMIDGILYSGSMKITVTTP